MPLPRCYFDISINGIPTGRIVFELFSDVCPRTCENFRSLCTGEKGEGKTTFKPLHYKGTLIHRIVKGFIVQGGDFENGDGSGGESIYGGFFKDETFKLKHESPFLLSMANKGTNTNGSQFFITTRSAAHLDGIHVVFGRVVSGMEFVTEIENQKVNSKNRPYADIRISNCGELVLLKRGKAVKAGKTSKVTDSSSAGSGSDSSVDGSETDDSETERKKCKRRRREKRKKVHVSKRSRKDRKHKSKKRRKKKQESDSSSGEEDEEDAPVVTSTITEDDLPPEISSTLNKKSWLYRYSKSPSPLDGEDATKKKRKREQFKLNDRETKQPAVIHVSGSGRVLKGRGNMRYRTPPPVQYGSRARYERSPDRDRYRNRSPDRDRYRNRSQDRDRHQRRSMDRDQRRQRSPDRDRYRSRSPDRDRYRKRSPGRDRYRSRSPDRDRYKQRSLDRDQRTPEKHENDSQPKGKDWLQEKSPGSRIGKEQYREESRRYGQRSPGQRSHNGETTVSQDDSSNQKMSHKDLQKSTDQVKDSSKTIITEDRETSTPPLSPQDHTPPLYDERTEYWSNEAYRLVKESFNLADKTAPHTTTSASKWDKEDNNDGGCGQSDEDNELATAYQKVEQTLAEQQFGISDLLDKHLKE